MIVYPRQQHEATFHRTAVAHCCIMILTVRNRLCFRLSIDATDIWHLYVWPGASWTHFDSTSPSNQRSRQAQVADFSAQYSQTGNPAGAKRSGQPGLEKSFWKQTIFGALGIILVGCFGVPTPHFAFKLLVIGCRGQPRGRLRYARSIFIDFGHILRTPVGSLRTHFWHPWDAFKCQVTCTGRKQECHGL